MLRGGRCMGWRRLSCQGFVWGCNPGTQGSCNPANTHGRVFKALHCGEAPEVRAAQEPPSSSATAGNVCSSSRARQCPSRAPFCRKRQAGHDRMPPPTGVGEFPKMPCQPVENPKDGPETVLIASKTFWQLLGVTPRRWEAVPQLHPLDQVGEFVEVHGTVRWLGGAVSTSYLHFFGGSRPGNGCNTRRCLRGRQCVASALPRAGCMVIVNNRPTYSVATLTPAASFCRSCTRAGEDFTRHEEPASAAMAATSVEGCQRRRRRDWALLHNVIGIYPAMY